MKELTTKWLIGWAVLKWLCVILFVSCQKEKQDTNEVTGKWETIQVVGWDWSYSFDHRSNACRQLPQYFPDTVFCYSYTQDRDTTYIQAEEKEKWVWDFQCENIAVVTQYVGGQKNRMILQRK